MKPGTMIGKVLKRSEERRLKRRMESRGKTRMEGKQETVNILFDEDVDAR